MTEFPAAPASAPEGRFHHSAQVAAYTSLSEEGACAAIQRYLKDDVPRNLIAMSLRADKVIDVRGVSDACVVWQEARAEGQIPATWAISDSARQAGAQAMIYSSRSRPNLSHAVVFDPDCLHFVGPVKLFKQ
jgi:hypothetical protein